MNNIYKYKKKNFLLVAWFLTKFLHMVCKLLGKIDDSADDGYGDSDEGYSFIR